jgi:hypothetical protein
MPHPNERVELAIQILECRRQLRRTGRDALATERLRTELESLEKMLREIDE